MARVPLELPKAWLKQCVRVIVNNAGEEWTHERILFWPVTGDRWTVVTPDGDEYEETFLEHIRRCGR